MNRKKMIALALSVSAIMAAVSGIILMATQIKTQGNGFFFGYLFYALAILAGGMFITWIPKMTNNNWGPKLENGRVKFKKSTNEVDTARTRLIWWPLITLSFEIFGIFDWCHELWNKPYYEILSIVFLVLTLLLLFVWIIIISIQQKREKKNSSL